MSPRRGWLAVGIAVLMVGVGCAVETDVVDGQRDVDDAPALTPAGRAPSCRPGCQGVALRTDEHPSFDALERGPLPYADGGPEDLSSSMDSQEDNGEGGSSDNPDPTPWNPDPTPWRSDNSSTNDEEDPDPQPWR